MNKVGYIFVFLQVCLAQQVQSNLSGTVSGALTGEDGTSIAGGYVTLLPASPQSGGPLLQSGPTMVTDANGVFTFTGLENGAYQLCAQVANTLWLNPCAWGLEPPTALLSDVQPNASITVVLKKGVAVRVRVSDPGGLLSSEATTPGAHLLLGIADDARVFRSATLVSEDATGRNHQVVIPYNHPVNVSVYSTFFRLSNSVGAAISGKGVLIPVQVQQGQQPPTITINVTAGGTP